MIRVSIAAAGFILAACSSPQELDAQIVEASGESVQATLERRVAASSAPTEFSDQETRGEAERDFDYSWPAQASAIPSLAAVLTERRDEALASQKEEWEQSVAEFAEMNCITCVMRSYSGSWEVAADTPRFLLLTGETFTYTGGAHGNSFFDALLWDRTANDGAGDAMRPVDMFVGEAALENIAFGDYCSALNLVRSERRDVDPTTVDQFDNCPSVTELVVMPTSSDGKSFDGVAMLAAPYVAGSFAEGPYEFSIPMTPVLLEAVKPEYRAEFSIPD